MTDIPCPSCGEPVICPVCEDDQKTYEKDVAFMLRSWREFKKGNTIYDFDTDTFHPPRSTP